MTSARLQKIRDLIYLYGGSALILPWVWLLGKVLDGTKQTKDGHSSDKQDKH